MALVPLHDGTWHLTAPDEEWGATRAHYLHDADVELNPDDLALRAGIAAYGLAFAHYQPEHGRRVLVELGSTPR